MRTSPPAGPPFATFNLQCDGTCRRTHMCVPLGSRRTIMKRAMNWLLAASLGAGGLALAGCDRDNANTTSNSGNSSTATDQNIRNKDDAAKVAGSQIPGDQIGVADLNNLYRTLGDTSEAALNKGSFDDMVERFVEADRKRIGDFKDMKFDDLDGRVDSFRTAWKAKYNADFDID